MIDFIKIHYSDKSRLEPFVKNAQNFVDLDMVLEYHSGEIRYPYRTKLDNMQVTLSENSGSVRNSIHKLFNLLKNSIEHNYNDFTYSNLYQTINYLSNKIIDSNTTKITQLEFGLNITVSTPAENFIKKNILMHNLKNYNHNRKYYGKGELKQFDHHNYFIKVYDKAKQFQLNENILRFEIKFIRPVEFQKMGIYCLEDLKDKSKLISLFKYLIKRFDELTIIDEFNSDMIGNEIDYNKLIKYINPNFWNEELENKSRQTKANYNKDFKRILIRYGLLKTKLYLRLQMINKFRFLLNN